jgi:predicted dehydrogenase
LKILLIGPGSIGTRHLRNILQLGYTDITVVSRSGVLPAEFSAMKVYSDVAGALASSSFDTAILCTPTALHTSDLLQLLTAKVRNIYIEKPVSHSIENLDEIVALAKSYSNNIVVGFDLHFDLGLLKIKELLSKETIGKLVSVNAQVGQYLPDWRPHEDYRNGMSAKRKTGGGVMLDLVHEFDYLLWLCGSVKKVGCFFNNSGALTIETEDIAEVLLSFESGVIGTIHLDYLQQKLVRNCMITGYNGSIFWDIAENKVRWINKEKEEQEYNYKGYERNDRFVNIMKAFLENAADERLTDLNKGIESLKLVLAAKHSSENNVFVQL